MDHIPVGEIGSQLPMFIDPTMIVDNVLAGYRDAADALGNSTYVGDPEDGNANAMALLMATFTEGDRRNRALGYAEEDIFPDAASASLAEGWRGGAAKALERQYAALVAAEPVPA